MLQWFQFQLILLIVTVFSNSREDFNDDEAPPFEATESLLPNLSGTPQLLPSPYNVSSNRWKLRAGCVASVFLRSIDGKTPFKGFLVVAKDSINASIGTFLEDENYKLLNVSRGKSNGATHLNEDDKIRYTVYWRAPPILKGPMRFVATIIKDSETYWNNVESEELVVDQ